MKFTYLWLVPGGASSSKVARTREIINEGWDAIPARRSTQFPPGQFVNVPAFFDRPLVTILRIPRVLILHKETFRKLGFVSSNNHFNFRCTHIHQDYYEKKRTNSTFFAKETATTIDPVCVEKLPIIIIRRSIKKVKETGWSIVSTHMIVQYNVAFIIIVIH